MFLTFECGSDFAVACVSQLIAVDWRGSCRAGILINVFYVPQYFIAVMA